MVSDRFAGEYLPVYDVSDAVAVVVEAVLDLLEVGRSSPMVGMLGAIRMLPEVLGHLFHGEPPDKPQQSIRLGDLPPIPMSDGGVTSRRYAARPSIC